MAHAAIFQLLGVDVVLIGEALTEGELVLRGLPLHVEYLFTRPDEFFRLRMAIEAPFHIERVLFPHQRHLVDSPVTGGTPDPLVQVYAVIKKNKIRQIMDTFPVERLIARKAGADGRQHRRIGPKLRVTRHAGFGGRNTGECRLLDGGVAITTIDPESVDMMFVTEWNGLVARMLNARRIG